MASDRMTDPAGQPAGGRAGEDSLGAKAKGAADRAAEEAGRQARSALDDARTAADEQARKAKDYAAGSFSESAEAIGRAAEEMPAGSVRHELLREASEGLGQIGRSLENRSIGELARGLSDFGRRNPVAFLGGAALVGLALGRFVRASSPDEVPQGAAGGDMGTVGALAMDRMEQLRAQRLWTLTAGGSLVTNTTVGGTPYCDLSNDGYIVRWQIQNNAFTTGYPEPFEYYLWIKADGDLCIASHATLANDSAFPDGNWHDLESSCTVVGGQS